MSDDNSPDSPDRSAELRGEIERTLSGITGPTPEEARARRLDALAGYRSFFLDTEDELPEWWAELWSQVKEAES